MYIKNTSAEMMESTFLKHTYFQFRLLIYFDIQLTTNDLEVCTVGFVDIVFNLINSSQLLVYVQKDVFEGTMQRVADISAPCEHLSCKRWKTLRIQYI